MSRSWSVSGPSVLIALSSPILFDVSDRGKINNKGRLGKRKQQLLETKINNTVRQFLRHEGSGRCNKGDFKRRIRTVLPNLNRDQVEKIRMQWDVRAGEMGEQRFDDLFADFDPEAAIDVVGAENSSGGEGPTQLAANQEDVGSSSNNSSSGSGEETAIQLQAGNQVQRVLAMQNAGIVVAAAGLLMESRTGENTHDGIDHAFRSQMSTTMDIPAELLRKGVAAQKIPSGDVTLSEEITGNNKTGEEGYSCSNNKKLKAAGNVLEEEQATVNYDSKKTRQVQQPSPSSQDDKDLDHGMVVDGDDKTSKAEKNIDSSTKNDAEIEEQVFEAIELNHDRETCAATLAAATTSNIRVKSSSSNSNDHKHCCGSAKNNTGTKDRNVCVPSNQDNDKMIENNRNKDLPAVASMRQQAGPRTEVSPSSSETPTTTGRVTSTSKLRAHWKDDTSSPDETHYLPAVASTQQDIQSLDPRPAPRPVDPVRPDPESPPQRVACQTQCSASIRQEASNYLTQFTQLVARFPPQSQYKTAVLLSRDLINHQPYCVGTPCLREALQEFLKMVVDHYNLRSVFLELALDMWRNPQPEGLYPPHISWCLE